MFVVVDTLPDTRNAALVSFANKSPGGGFLHNGSVQEEILFAEMPELALAKGTHNQMNDSETILMRNLIRYNKVQGYGRSNNDKNRTPAELENTEGAIEDNSHRYNVLFIDAINYKGQVLSQYELVNKLRELIKAFTGFFQCYRDQSQISTIISGLWGCGAFKGDYKLKLPIQILAAALAIQYGRDKFHEESQDDSLHILDDTKTLILSYIRTKEQQQFLTTFLNTYTTIGGVWEYIEHHTGILIEEEKIGGEEVTGGKVSKSPKKSKRKTSKSPKKSRRKTSKSPKKSKKKTPTPHLIPDEEEPEEVHKEINLEKILSTEEPTKVEETTLETPTTDIVHPQVIPDEEETFLGDSPLLETSREDNLKDPLENVSEEVEDIFGKSELIFGADEEPTKVVEPTTEVPTTEEVKVVEPDIKEPINVETTFGGFSELANEFSTLL
jgi:hypothetical protein